MKRRHIDPADGCDPEELLLRAFGALDGPAELRAFLRDLCTPAELEALRDRWRVVPHLLRGLTYRQIHELTGVSITTIGRVARFYSEGNGGYRLVAQRLFAEDAVAGADRGDIERGLKHPPMPAQAASRANADPATALTASKSDTQGTSSSRP